MPARPDNASAARPVSMARPILDKEREMPKMKTKSSVKKRFRTTASGRIKMSPAKKRHNLRKRSQKMKRHARGMEVMRPEDERIVKKFMPYG
jgi:large subunit ribosomal protein L35